MSTAHSKGRPVLLGQEQQQQQICLAAANIPAVAAAEAYEQLATLSAATAEYNSAPHKPEQQPGRAHTAWSAAAAPCSAAAAAGIGLETGQLEGVAHLLNELLEAQKGKEDLPFTQLTTYILAFRQKRRPRAFFASLVKHGNR
eukprot:104851-Pelagomonas_calceolata.AAC.9